MKVTVEFDLPPSAIKAIRANSIERVMNNAVALGLVGEKQLPRQGDRECASTLWQDCEDLKPIVERLWNTVRNSTWRLDLEEKQP
jgi:hypothetical protein